MIKDQLARLSASSITRGVTRQGPTGNIAATYTSLEHFEVWFPKDERQRVLWPSTGDLFPTYFESLPAHAVPLNESHIAALSPSAMALDIYAWQTQYLCCAPAGKDAFISWAALHSHFGQGYNRLNNFHAASGSRAAPSGPGILELARPSFFPFFTCDRNIQGIPKSRLRRAASSGILRVEP